MRLTQLRLLKLFCVLFLSVVGCANTGSAFTPACTPGDKSCGQEKYCEAQEEACTGPGVCTAIPKMCTKIYSPVCGCDGKDYGNECGAAAAGTSIRHRGKCTVEPEKKACANDSECANKQYCAFSKGDCGKSKGNCVTKPEVCTTDYAPVCGCNGETYSNRCNAAGRGVSIQKIGECPIT